MPSLKSSTHRFRSSKSLSPLLRTCTPVAERLLALEERQKMLINLQENTETIINAHQVVSTLSILEPLRRLVGRIPFLYQRVSSTSPVTALISPKPVVTSLAVVHLDGSTDWMVIGRSLLTWTGQTVSVRPKINSKMVRLTGPWNKFRG